MRKLLASLTPTQKVTIAAVIVLMVAGLLWLTRTQQEKDFRPLFTNLSPEDAGSVVQRLKESAAQYRLSDDGRTVYVPSARVAELRLSLAAQGLPRNGRIGFELFDKTSFGATEFTEQVNYRRALEGELERSIMTLNAVEQARVHLTFPKESVFTESRQPAKASVLLKLHPGAQLLPANVSAISHLVASAVEGLSPEAVTILDMYGNLLNRPRRQVAGGDPAAEEANLEFRQALERDLASKITNTLEPLLGPDRFRVSVTAECDFTSGEQSEEILDPSRSVMLASQRTEEYGSTPAPSGTPGTASNLPRPSSRPASSSTGLARQSESITYQSSRTVRRIRLPVGTVKRVSVAVVVDHEVAWTDSGGKLQRVVNPPSAEKLKTIQELASAAAGLNPERGDQITVVSLPFGPAEPLAQTSQPQPETPKQHPAPTNWMPDLRTPLTNQKLLVAAGGAVALVVLMLVGLILARRKRKAKVEVTVGAQLPEGPHQPPQVAPAEHTEPGPGVQLPPAPPKKAEILAGKLRETVKADPVASAQILRTWLTEEES